MTDVITMPDLHVAHSDARLASGLDPVTFEVLKNAFVTSVDLMSEQILRTCYSFVIYSRDFSSALCDANGNTVMQGSGDIAVHVGTLHFQCKAVIERLQGRHPRRRRVRDQRPVPGRHALQRRQLHHGRSFGWRGDRLRPEQGPLGRHWRQRTRIIRCQRQGALRRGTADHSRPNLEQRHLPPRCRPAAGVEHPGTAQAMGDLQAQSEATAVCEREIRRLVVSTRNRRLWRRCRKPRTMLNGSSGVA